MSPLLFDLIIVVLIFLSAGLGFLRGFCNEIFTIFGWIGAVLATILLTPVARPFLRENMKSMILADLATASAIFVITMIIFTVISHYATKTLQDSKLNAVDRSLGFAFGLLRAIILLGLGFLLIAYIWSPEDRPEAIQKAKTRPILEATAHMVRVIIPGGDESIQISAKDAKTKLDDVMQGKVAEETIEQFKQDIKGDTPGEANDDADDKPDDAKPAPSTDSKKAE